ncbi:MAG: aminotransferase class V-fold PLP-dependent enzyme [Robiginitomaculum sp.]|nr:aminotransferase class V-fold PLP-dependent enzyme [Robiginitomaculum sp.]MDQ7078147.1 aminotransferase class V-fold PLP-dependent enzyme [Robiginitomaculum sp.]
MTISELDLIEDANRRARAYLASVEKRRVFPDVATIESLSIFEEDLRQHSLDAQETLCMVDDIGSPATVTSNGPRYFGFVIGATLPIAAAVDRLAQSWDQCASSHINSPAAAAIEKAATRLVLQALNLPQEATIGFGTSATACGLSCLAVARRELLARLGWDVDQKGLMGAPPIRVVVSKMVHITIIKSLRILGFGLQNIIYAPVDAHGRIDPEQLPDLDDHTILCLQAGEVNTGAFDPFAPLIAAARQAGAWVHVDGAFGLWARASRDLRHLTDGLEEADSWTTDGHKWLNTPYDSAMAICRDGGAMAACMNADAVYARAEPDAQKNLTLEFSRKARGISIWAVLRTLGRDGLDQMISRHHQQAQRLAQGLLEAGIEVLNTVVLNQVLARLDTDERTMALIKAVQDHGVIWFGGTRWNDRAAFRLSVSSWRTTNADIETAIGEIKSRLGRL